MPNRFLDLAFLGALTIIGGCSKPSAVEKHPRDATGICFRDLRGSDVTNKAVHRFESVLVKSSGNLAKDFERIASLDVDGGMLRSPDLVSLIWHSAWISDRTVDAVDGPSCEGLPQILDSSK